MTLRACALLAVLAAAHAQAGGSGQAPASSPPSDSSSSPSGSSPSPLSQASSPASSVKSGGDSGCLEFNKDGVCVCPANCVANDGAKVAYGCSHKNGKKDRKAASCGGVPNTKDPYSVIKHNGACTPFAFLPYRQSCGNPATEIANDADPPIVWQANGASDFWVFHGCDGSGTQPDCIGDVLWLEHFYTMAGDGVGHDVSIKEGSCKDGVTAHAWCVPIHAPWKPLRLLSLLHERSLECWLCESRLARQSEGRVVAARRRGAARVEVRPLAVPQLQRRRQKIRPGDQPISVRKPKPDLLVVGNLQPWVCTDTIKTNDFPNIHKYYSTAAGETTPWKCYSDDEAWNGQTCRKSNYTDCTPNWNTQFVYCGYYRSAKQLQCRLYRARADPECDGKCSSCSSSTTGDTCGGKCSTKCGLHGHMEEIGQKHFTLNIRSW